MGKKLAIRGHSIRGKEVIELLEMLGGKNCFHLHGLFSEHSYYFIGGLHNDEIRAGEYMFDEYAVLQMIDDMCFFTLEEFLEKYPYRVGDKVHIYVQNDDIDGRYDIEVAEITSMRWNPARCKIAYKMKDINREFYKEEIKCKVDDASNKMNDCKKCGLHFGSVRCFDKDCPHNTPKSYAVGLKDGKVIDCIANKETYMNEIKPLFKTGDVVKLKGCPDKNIFWIVMDVIEDGYIFNDGIKYSFDDQHHYEKSDREIIDMTKETFTLAPDITANITDKNNCDIACPDGYEFYDENGNLIGNKVMMRRKKPVYPKTYKECCDVLGIDTLDNDAKGYKHFLVIQFQELLIARDAYWKIAGEQMGLGKPWEPDWNDESQKYCIRMDRNKIVNCSSSFNNRILAFPTEEMRDAFYENFKDLIEQCKELL